VCCSVLQCVALCTHMSALITHPTISRLLNSAYDFNLFEILQYVAVCCSVLRRVAKKKIPEKSEGRDFQKCPA